MSTQEPEAHWTRGSFEQLREFLLGVRRELSENRWNIDSALANDVIQAIDDALERDFNGLEDQLEALNEYSYEHVGLGDRSRKAKLGGLRNAFRRWNQRWGPDEPPRTRRSLAQRFIRWADPFVGSIAAAAAENPKVVMAMEGISEVLGLVNNVAEDANEDA